MALSIFLKNEICTKSRVITWEKRMIKFKLLILSSAQLLFYFISCHEKINLQTKKTKISIQLFYNDYINIIERIPFNKEIINGIHSAWEYRYDHAIIIPISTSKANMIGDGQKLHRQKANPETNIPMKAVFLSLYLKK